MLEVYWLDFILFYLAFHKSSNNTKKDIEQVT